MKNGPKSLIFSIPRDILAPCYVARVGAPSDYVGVLLSWKPAHRVTTLDSGLLEVLPTLRGEEDRHAAALAVHEERPLHPLPAGVQPVVAAARTVPANREYPR